MNTTPSIQPITSAQEEFILKKTSELISQACSDLDKQVPPIEIKFDLKGRAAGMYCSRYKERWFRFNPYLFAKYFDENIEQTIPHEVAHYLVDSVFGQKHVQPHGKEWVTMMKLLGCTPERTHRFDMKGIPVKRQRRHIYHCACQEHALSSTRHNRTQRNKHHAYYCRSCGESLIYAGH